MYTNMDELLSILYKKVYPKEDRSRIQQCLQALGNPEKGLQTIQVVGTNGKGSVTNYITQILLAQGYRVGSFTSPHLEVHNDRIRINDENISDEDFLSLANAYLDTIDAYKLNMFEIDFIFAILYFKEKKVDYAVFEAGMGGRLDATTELVPLVQVITNIGMDHMQFLGDTPQKIAEEKAAILKKDIVCICAEKKEECRKVFDNKAKEIGAQMEYVDSCKVIQYPPLVIEENGQEINLGNVALYQKENAACVLGVIRELRKQGIEIKDDAIIEGFTHPWAGRFECVSTSPLVYIDGAHNEHGVRALCETIKMYHMPTHILFAALKDKDVEGMLADLEEVSEDVTLTTFDYPRARKKDEYPEKYEVIDNYEEAIQQLLKKEGLLIITGSLYFISLVKIYFKLNANNKTM